MSQTTITLLFLVFAIVSFILEKIPLGLTASICALGLTLTGILDVSTTFSQYVNSNVILCIGMFVVGQALFETGMANKIGGLVTRFAKTEKTLIIAIMVIAGVMSGFLSNTGTAAVLIPVVCGIADESGYSRSHLLMPLVFAAALGGNLSIIGAPGNLMGVNALQEMGVEHADAARAEQAILKELADLCDGPITDEELEDCRRGLLSGMNGVEDSLGGMETWYYIEVLRAGANSAAPIQTPAQARAALQAVTKEDVRSILRQLTLSVSYLLTKEEPTHA